MTTTSGTMLMVEVVTLEGIRVEESWFPIQNVDGSVARIVVNDRSFPIVLKGTTTPKQFSPVYVQQCNIPVDNVADRRLQLFQRVRK